MTASVIVEGARTPMARLPGRLKVCPTVELSSVATTAALKRSGVRPDRAPNLILRQVLQAGDVGEQGLPVGRRRDCTRRPAHPVRKLDFIVAGGMASMTNAPHLHSRLRVRHKSCTVETLDSMAIDGLVDAYADVSMGESTDRHNVSLPIGRLEQQGCAARPQQPAAVASTHGVPGAETVLATIPDRRGEPVDVNGGAIALGHPIGMSGARLVLHLALELNRRGGGIGAAALCGGGGQGEALLLRIAAISATELPK